MHFSPREAILKKIKQTCPHKSILLYQIGSIFESVPCISAQYSTTVIFNMVKDQDQTFSSYIICVAAL